LTPKEQLIRLVRVQVLAREARDARAVVEGAPDRIEEIEGRFRERNAEYVAVKTRFDDLEADRKRRSLELEALEENRKKFMESLMQVQNQREYAAVLKELDAVKAAIGEHEEAILKAMEELETLKSDLEARSSHIEQERAQVETERSAVEAEVRAAGEKIAAAEAERTRIEGELPEPLVSRVKRVEEARGGLFLVPAEHEMCTACQVRVRPQVYQEIKLASRIHACGSCRRYLYHESLVDTPSADAPTPSGSAELGMADGGAV